MTGRKVNIKSGDIVGEKEYIFHEFGRKNGESIAILEKSNGEIFGVSYDQIQFLSDLKPTGLTDKNGTEMFEGDEFYYTSHDGYLLPSFKGKVVWIAEYAAFGYEDLYNVIPMEPTPFTHHHEIREDFLNYVELIK